MKVSYQHGILVKSEATYQENPTLSTSTDGVYVPEPPEFTNERLFNGERRAQTGGWYKGTTPTGKKGSGSVVLHPRGAGAAYSSSAVVPYDVHAMLQASGYTASLAGGVWTYTPAATNSVPSAAMQCYYRGELHKLYGVYANVEMLCDGIGIPKWTFAFAGVWDPTVYADAAVPAITINAAIMPPVAEGMTITIGNYLAPVVRRWRFAPSRDLQDRQSISFSGGYYGAALLNRSPVLEMTIEQTSLVSTPYHSTSGLDPMRLWDAGTSVAVNTTCGSANNRWRVYCPQAQLANVVAGDDNGIATWELTFHPHQSTATGNDDHTIVFD
jgi:hypothetical protein